MKPVSVRFKCFGPYVEEQFIDFRELEKNGLFLICGETGAGKTTILDAMCYALYGKSSGGLRGDLSVMRCKLADKSEETLVEFIFDSDGKRYKFIRSLKYGRKNLNDSHNCLVLEGETYVPIFENPKATFVNKKAEELIGLTYDQFRQVIILPQGQFEKLLVSNSEEKEQILVSLFHADRWQRMADELHRRVAEQDKALNEEKVLISSKLRQYGCESLPQLEEKAGEEQTLRDELKARTVAAEQTAAEQKRLWEQALLENQGFEVLKNLETDYRELKEKEAYYAVEEEILQSADAAERIRPQFTAWQDAKTKKLRAEGLLTQKTAAWEQAERKLSEVQHKQEVHTAARNTYDEQKQQLTLLENARELYRSLAEKQSSVVSAESALHTAGETLKKAEKQFEQKDKLWQQAIKAQDIAIRTWQQAQGLYLQGIGGVLAQRLVAGEPCPVCGSREHPQPAKAEDAHVSESELERLNQAMNDANDASTAALNRRKAAETGKKEAETAFYQAEQAANLARADYESALSRKISGIDTETALETKSRTLQRAVEDYEKKERQLAIGLADAQGNRKAALAEHQTAMEELTAAEGLHTAQLALWQHALAGSGLESEERFRAADMEPKERQRRNADLLRFRGDLTRAAEALEQQRLALEGKTAPDMETIPRLLKAAEQAVKDASSALALTESSLKAITEDIKNLSGRIARYEAERERANANLDFANRLRGRSGISLQRYVLGVMLTSITAEANRLLANVYGGRYRLYRTDEIAGSARKSGLELEVYDSQNDQRRSVTTLSGGEKFLVALSLAIGLSTVVQAQGSGIRLEAMFIDEGFGSLDREAIADALEVLQDIQRSAGTVGIISHVEALAESIPAKIEIVKGSRGSRCVIRN